MIGVGAKVRDMGQLQGTVLEFEWVRPEGSDLQASNTVGVALVKWNNDQTSWIEARYLAPLTTPSRIGAADGRE